MDAKELIAAAVEAAVEVLQPKTKIERFLKNQQGKRVRCRRLEAGSYTDSDGALTAALIVVKLDQEEARGVRLTIAKHETCYLDMDELGPLRGELLALDAAVKVGPQDRAFEDAAGFVTKSGLGFFVVGRYQGGHGSTNAWLRHDEARLNGQKIDGVYLGARRHLAAWVADLHEKLEGLAPPE